jgi:peptide-methionine (S)-S-oxide reductase
MKHLTLRVAGGFTESRYDWQPFTLVCRAYISKTDFDARTNMAYEHKLRVPTESEALPGRSIEMPVPEQHFVNGNPLKAPFPEGLQQAVFGMGCFWGAERLFWETPGVYTTSVGYAGGTTPNPSYEEVCSGLTGHTEVIMAVFDPQVVDYYGMLKVFWEGHNPTQGMRQGNDIGTQYRSAVYTLSDVQAQQAQETRAIYQNALTAAGFGEITTEILPAREYFYAEHYHQQYLAKVPNGYCGLGGTGVGCNTRPLVKAL